MREAEELFEGIEVVEVGEVFAEEVFDVSGEFGRRVRVLGVDVEGGVREEVVVSGLGDLEVGRGVAEVVDMVRVEGGVDGIGVLLVVDVGVAVIGGGGVGAVVEVGRGVCAGGDQAEGVHGVDGDEDLSVA